MHSKSFDSPYNLDPWFEPQIFFFSIDTKMQVSVELTEWIVIHPNHMSQKVRSFVQLIQKVGGPQGFKVPEPH